MEVWYYTLSLIWEMHQPYYIAVKFIWIFHFQDHIMYPGRWGKKEGGGKRIGTYDLMPMVQEFPTFSSFVTLEDSAWLGCFIGNKIYV